MPLARTRRAVRFDTQRAVLAAVAAVVLAAVAYLAPGAIAIPVALLVLALGFGWPLLLGLGLHGAHVLVLLVPGLAAVGVAVMADDAARWITLAIAGGVVLAFISALARWGKDPSPVEAVAAVVTGQLAVVAASGWILAARSTPAELPLLGALVLVVAAIGVVVRLPVFWAVVAATAVCALAGAAGAYALPSVPTAVGAAVGALVGATVATIQALVEDSPSIRAGGASVAAALVPVAVTGLVLYAVGRTLLA